MKEHLNTLKGEHEAAEATLLEEQIFQNKTQKAYDDANAVHTIAAGHTASALAAANEASGLRSRQMAMINAERSAAGRISTALRDLINVPAYSPEADAEAEVARALADIDLARPHSEVDGVDGKIQALLSKLAKEEEAAMAREKRFLDSLQEARVKSDKTSSDRSAALSELNNANARTRGAAAARDARVNDIDEYHTDKAALAQLLLLLRAEASKLEMPAAQALELLEGVDDNRFLYLDDAKQVVALLRKFVADLKTWDDKHAVTLQSAQSKRDTAWEALRNANLQVTEQGEVIGNAKARVSAALAVNKAAHDAYETERLTQVKERELLAVVSAKIEEFVLHQGQSAEGSLCELVDGVACSGAGSCTTEGACRCNFGHVGEMCETCAEGYLKVDGSCVKEGSDVLDLDLVDLVSSVDSDGDVDRAATRKLVDFVQTGARRSFSETTSVQQLLAQLIQKLDNKLEQLQNAIKASVTNHEAEVAAEHQARTTIDGLTNDAAVKLAAYDVASEQLKAATAVRAVHRATHDTQATTAANMVELLKQHYTPTSAQSSHCTGRCSGGDPIYCRCPGGHYSCGYRCSRCNRCYIVNPLDM